MEDQIYRTIEDSIKVVKDTWSKDLVEIRSMLRELVGNLPTSKSGTVEFQRFCGENPKLWISQAERYFNFYKIEEDQKLNVASFYFDGEALEWYRWLFHNKQLAGWDHFVDKLMIRFCSRNRDISHGFLPVPKNKNDKAVDYYQEAIPSWGNITNSSSPQSYDPYNLFAENFEVDHMFNKIPEKGNDLDSSDITSVENNRDTFEEMHYRPSLIISSVLSVHDQMVTVQDLSNNTTNDEAISFPNKVLSELPHDQSSREGGQHVCTTSLSLCAFGVHNDNSMNTSFLGEVVDDAELMKAITAVKYWKMVVVGREYNGCELPDDLGLFSMDEVFVKHFRISTTRMFDDSLRWSCAIGCGHKVARSLIRDPNFSWTVIFKEFVLKDIDEEVDKAFPSFTSIYLLVDDISAIGSTIVWNARIALLEAGMVVQLVRNGNNMDDYISGCFVRLFLHFVVAYNMDVVYMIHLWTTGVIDNGGAVNWTRTYQIARVAKRMNTSVSAVVESYKFTRLMSLDRPKVVPTFCPIDFFIQRTSLVDLLIRNNFFSLTDEVGLHLNFVLDYISTIVHGVMKHLNQLNQGLPLVLVKFCTNPPFQALSYKYQPRGVCCRDICHFRGGMVLVKVGQDVQEVMKVMPISLILSKDNIKLNFASDHLDHFLWPNLLLDGGVLFHFTLVSLQCVGIVTRLIIERVLDEFHDLNLEDKVLFESGSIVVNQTDSVRAYGLLESFIWDPGPITIC
ncbi:hypothetical protein KY290_031030 [Solanum tuberosum]|uniref:Retrotransposon gag domain-containing protein n=1 Tax=Solanum tuberosum TaxID=4113 RepID=A0ABQ7U807_SOLTU|nr:hypothetical protein KY290_031030 [Solanum tuberosum]